MRTRHSVPTQNPCPRSAAVTLLVVTLLVACTGGREPSAPSIIDPDPVSPATLSDITAEPVTPPSGPGQSSSPVGAKRTAPATAAIANVAAVTAGVPRDQAVAQAAPFGLSASDGTGLVLRSVDARVIIEGPLAFTELHLTFTNPAPRQLEGRFTVTLPPGAAVSRFAMKTAGRWMEGEVVERKRARRIYEDYLHKRQDPALLEVDAGNRFRARVFPIPARGRKELIVSWSQQRVDPRAAYRLPLVGLPTLDRLRVRAWLYGSAGGARLVRLDRRHVQPAVDLELYPSALGDAIQGFRSGRVAMARVTAREQAAPTHHSTAWLVVDTSASTTRYQGATLRLLPVIARQLATAGVTRFVVVAFDQEQRVVWRGGLDDIKTAVDRLRQRGAMGASNLAAALAFVGAQAGRSAQKRVILISDGVVTAGARQPDALRRGVRALAHHGFTRLDALSLASARDEPLLTSLARGQLAQDGVFIRPSREGRGIERLRRRTLAPVVVRVPGAAWVWPTTIRGLQAGQSALVWAELPEGAPFSVRLSGGMSAVQHPHTRPAMAPLLERAWVRARIAMLSEAHMGAHTAARARLKAKAIQLSLRHRVLSPWTAFLVLQNERELRRYGIEQTRPADILAVTQGGQVSRLNRRALHRDRESRAGDDLPGEEIHGADDDEAKTVDKTVGKTVGKTVDKTELTAAEARKKPPARSGLGDRPWLASTGQRNKDVQDALDAVAKQPAEPSRQRFNTLRGQGASGLAPRPRSLRDGAAAPVTERESAPLTFSSTGTGAGGGGVGRGRAVRSSFTRRRVPRVVTRTTSVRVVGPLPVRQARRTLARAGFRRCAEGVMRRTGVAPRGWLQLNVLVNGAGGVAEAHVVRSVFGAQSPLSRCVTRIVRRARFPATVSDRSSMLTWTLTFGSSVSAVSTRSRRRSTRGVRERSRAIHKAADHAAMQGRMRDLQRLLDRKQPRLARDLGRRWAADRPDDVLAWVALGRALRAAGQPDAAARAWGSILDLHPSRADMRRFAGNLLEQVAAGRALALDTYAEAVRQRPDQPSGYVQLALAQAHMGDLLAGLRSLRAGLSAHRRRGRNRRGVDKTIRRLTQVLAGAWLKTHRNQTDRLTQAAGWVVPDTRSVGMLLLTWESDANDVDLHVFGRNASHAFFSRQRGAGGRLTADVTTGYGPELFEARDTRSRRVLVHYYRRGPMGYGLGRVLRINHDGRGGLTFRARPFVAMRDHAWVDVRQF